MGAATCLYVSTKETNLVQELQSIGMISDFFAPVHGGLETRRSQSHVRADHRHDAARAWTPYGGYQVIEDRPADDVYAGRLVAEQGYEVKLLPYVVQSVADFNTHERPASQAHALDDGAAPDAPLGPLRIDLHLGIAVGAAAVAIPSDGRRSRPAYLGGYALCRIVDHVDHRRVGNEAARPLEEDAADSSLGRDGLRHVARQFRAQNDSLARRRLFSSRGKACGRHAPLKRFAMTVDAHDREDCRRRRGNLRIDDCDSPRRRGTRRSTSSIRSASCAPRPPSTNTGSTPATTIRAARKRSAETLEARAEFMEAFAPAIVRNSLHYYAIPKGGSQTPPDTFRAGDGAIRDLSTSQCRPEWMDFGFIDKCYEVDEQIYDPDVLRESG